MCLIYVYYLGGNGFEDLYMYEYFTSLYITILSACLVSLEARKGPPSQDPWIGVTVGCELLCGYWELNLASLQEH